MYKKRIFFFVFLLFFLCISLTTEFFHQEKTLEPVDLCPIGIWHMNSIALAGLCFLAILIIFTVITHLYYFNHKVQTHSPFYYFCHRAPPWKQ